MRGGGVGEGRRGLSEERPLLPSPHLSYPKDYPCLNFPEPTGSAKRPVRCMRPQWTRRACPPNSSSSTSAASAVWNSPPVRKPSSPAISFPAWPACSAAGPMANPPPTFSVSANSTAGTSGSRPPPSFPALKPSTSSKRPSKAATAPPALRIWVRAAAASP